MSHTRSKSAPVAHPKGSDTETDGGLDRIENILFINISGSEAHPLSEVSDEDDVDGPGRPLPQPNRNGGHLQHGSESDERINQHFYDLPEGEDYMAIYETIDRKRAEAKELKNKSASMEELETPTPSVKSFSGNGVCVESGGSKAEPQVPVREKRRHRSKGAEQRKSVEQSYDPGNDGMAQFLKKALRIEVTIILVSY